jgi:hypothetical protein
LSSVVYCVAESAVADHSSRLASHKISLHPSIASQSLPAPLRLRRHHQPFSSHVSCTLLIPITLSFCPPVRSLDIRRVATHWLCFSRQFSLRCNRVNLRYSHGSTAMTNQYYHDPIPYRGQPPARGRSPPASRARSTSRHQHYSPRPQPRTPSTSRYSPEISRDRHYSPTRNPITRSHPPPIYSPPNERVISLPQFTLVLRYDERKLVKGMTFANCEGDLTSQICVYSYCHLSSLAFRFKVVIPCLLFGLARLTNTPLPPPFSRGLFFQGLPSQDVTLIKVVHW